MAKFCPNCGNTLADDAKFCGKCGADQAPAQNETETVTQNETETVTQNVTENVMGSKMNMAETIKMSFGRPTVKIALGAVILIYVSYFLPWINEELGSTSMVMICVYIGGEILNYVGFLIWLIAGPLWVAAWFLLNHPKLTLVSDIIMAFIWYGWMITGGDTDLNIGGIGYYLYIIMVAVCVVMAFLTKRIKPARQA